MSLELPDLIYLEDFNGDFTAYDAAVYEIFRNDFVNSRPKFNGIRLGLKKHPIFNEREYTYYHFTHSGNIEHERIPDMRRMECIRYARFFIENCNHKDLKVWRNNHKGHYRILIFHEESNYLLILDDKVEYILPWTAYLITHPNRIRRLIKEYETYIGSL